MSGLHHREPGMVGAALSTQDKSYSELICDGHHVNPVSAGIVMHAKGHEHVASSPTACAPAACPMAITSWANCPSWLPMALLASRMAARWPAPFST